MDGVQSVWTVAVYLVAEVIRRSPFLYRYMTIADYALCTK